MYTAVLKYVSYEYPILIVVQDYFYITAVEQQYRRVLHIYICIIRCCIFILVCM